MKIIIMVAIILSLVAANNAFGSDPVIIAVDENNPPFMYEDGDSAAGLYPTLVEFIFQRMQTPVVIKPMPWKRALMNADNGLMGIAGIYKNSERLKKYDYSEALFQEKLAVFVHKERTFPFSSLKDMKGKTIGTIRGWSYGDDFDLLRTDNLFIVEETGSDEQNFRKLLLKRLDCLIAVEDSGKALLEKEEFSGKIVQLDPYIAVNSTHLIFPKSADMTELLSQFNAELEKMKSNGEYAQFTRMFFSR